MSTLVSTSGLLAEDFCIDGLGESGTNALLVDNAYFIEDIKTSEPKETSSQTSSPVKGRIQESLKRPSTAPETFVKVGIPEMLAKSATRPKTKSGSRPINYNTIGRMRSIYTSAFKVKERHDTLASRGGLPPWRGVNDGKLASQS